MPYQPDHYEAAKKKVNQIKRFQGRLISFVLMSILFLFFFTAVARVPWVSLFIIIPWAVGLAKEGIQIYGFGGNWEEKMIAHEMDKLELEELRQYRRKKEKEERLRHEIQTEEQDFLDLEELKEIRPRNSENDFV